MFFHSAVKSIFLHFMRITAVTFVYWALKVSKTRSLLSVSTQGNYAESLPRFAVIYGSSIFSVLSAALFVEVYV